MLEHLNALIKSVPQALSARHSQIRAGFKRASIEVQFRLPPAFPLLGHDAFLLLHSGKLYLISVYLDC